MRRLFSIPHLEMALWSLCAGIAGYIVVSAAIEGRWGRALFFAALIGALAWAIHGSRLKS